jgi:hypothetical protein
MLCSASAHAHASRGGAHALRDGDEADADEPEGGAGVAAGPGEQQQSDPSRGSEARHALYSARAHTNASDESDASAPLTHPNHALRALHPFSFIELLNRGRHAGAACNG